jgi:heptosyltransferase-3
MPVAKRILIYRLGSLGDTIAALPVFNTITEAFPNADISLLTNQPILAKAAAIESVLGGNPFFNRIIKYPVGTRNLLLLFKLIKEIRRFKPDTVCYLASVRARGSMRKTRLTVWRDKLFFKAAGIKEFIGLPQLPEDFLLATDPLTGEREWEPQRLARRFKSLGEINLADDRLWNLHFTDEELALADSYIKPLDNNHPIVVASIGTKLQANDWEQPNWTDLLKRLSQNLPGAQLIMLGAADEAERANSCLEAWAGSNLNLCGQTSPRVSAAILKQAKVFIGHDSGPMHLAACVGTPCVAVYSARNLPRQWFPRGDFNQIIYHHTDCAGCGLGTCIIQQKKCILSITVGEVEQAVMKVLNLNGVANTPDA